jgi:ribonuclease-3
LCSKFPEADEGLLTRMRAQLVNTAALATWAREHELSAAILVGRGAEANGLRDSSNVLADCLEALIAAVFLEAGYNAAHEACRMIVSRGLEKFERGPSVDPKTDLQERVQASSQAVPRYSVVESWGPAHDRWFRVAVSIEGREIAQGVGRSKRTAEREAARAALASSDDELSQNPSAGLPDRDS